MNEFGPFEGPQTVTLETPGLLERVRGRLGSLAERYRTPITASAAAGAVVLVASCSAEDLASDDVREQMENMDQGGTQEQVDEVAPGTSDTKQNDEAIAPATSGSAEAVIGVAEEIEKWGKEAWEPNCRPDSSGPLVREKEHSDGSLTVTLLPPHNSDEIGPNDNPYVVLETHQPSTADAFGSEFKFKSLAPSTETSFTISADDMNKIKYGRTAPGRPSIYGTSGGYGFDIINIPNGYEMPASVSDPTGSVKSIAGIEILDSGAGVSLEQINLDEIDPDLLQAIQEVSPRIDQVLRDTFRFCSLTGYEVVSDPKIDDVYNESAVRHDAITTGDEYDYENRFANDEAEHNYQEGPTPDQDASAPTNPQMENEAQGGEEAIEEIDNIRENFPFVGDLDEFSEPLDFDFHQGIIDEAGRLQIHTQINMSDALTPGTDLYKQEFNRLAQDATDYFLEAYLEKGYDPNQLENVDFIPYDPNTEND